MLMLTQKRVVEASRYGGSVPLTNVNVMCYLCLMDTKGHILALLCIQGPPLDDLDPFRYTLKIDQRARSKFHGPLEFYETWNV